MELQIPICINEAISKIDNKEYLLPAIQQEFSWSTEQIEWLFDSLMQELPIGSFIVWEVNDKDNIIDKFKFYKFITHYREYDSNNEEENTNGLQRFTAILDGQQRLTALYIGLRGSYAYKVQYDCQENTEKSLQIRHLYLNLSSLLKNDKYGRKHDFKFLKKENTQCKELYKDSENRLWFRVGKILDYREPVELVKIFPSIYAQGGDEFAIDTIKQLHHLIVMTVTIIFYEETEQDLNKALNIFIRMKNDSKKLDFDDLTLPQLKNLMRR